MKAGKIALWTFIALVLSGLLFAFSLAEDFRKNGGSFSLENGMVIGPGETIQVDETKTAPTQGIRRIEIRTDSPDLAVTLTDAADASVRLHGTVKTTSPDAVPHLSLETKGDTLVYTLTRKNPLSVGFFNSSLVLEASLPKEWKENLILAGSSAQITLPEGTFASLSVSTSSGDQSIGTVGVAGNLTMNASSGLLQLKQATCDSAEITSTSGDKKLESLQAKGSVKVDGSSSNVTMGTISATSVRIGTTSGDVSAETVKADTIETSGSSAYWRLKGLSGRLKAESTSGDMNVEFAAPGESIQISASSGLVKALFPKDSGLSVDVKTSSGNLSGSLALDSEKKTDHEWSGTKGDKSVHVRIQTSSGDVSLDQ